MNKVLSAAELQPAQPSAVQIPAPAKSRRKPIVMHRQSVVGLQSQKEAVQQQAEIVKKELGIKTGLLDKGLTNRTEYSQLLRSEADLVGQAGALEANLAAANTQIVEAQEQIERLTTQRVEEALTKLDEVRSNLADVEEQIRAAEAVLRRTTIKAPAAGIVVSSTYNTKGSVIARGEKIMAFLPQFIDASAALPVWLQFVVLGTIVNLMFSSADIVCVFLAGLVISRLRRSSRAQRVMQRAGGAVLVGLGVHVALQKS